MEDIELDMMTRKERAKQFMPFDAMKGLKEALLDREERHSRVDKHGVSEETQEKLSKLLKRADRGMRVWISHYYCFHDVEQKGTITKIDKVYRVLWLGELKVFFDNIYDMEILDMGVN